MLLSRKFCSLSINFWPGLYICEKISTKYIWKMHFHTQNTYSWFMLFNTTIPDKNVWEKKLLKKKNSPLPPNQCCKIGFPDTWPRTTTLIRGEGGIVVYLNEKMRFSKKFSLFLSGIVASNRIFGAHKKKQFICFHNRHDNKKIG